MSVQWFWRRNGRYWALKEKNDDGPALLKIREYQKNWILYTLASEVVDEYPTLQDAQQAGQEYLKQQQAVL